MIKNFAKFSADFPDDSLENADGDIVVPAGRSIASAIASRIASASTPLQHSFYGWRFEFRCFSGNEAWALLQQPGPWLLTVEVKGWFLRESKKDAVLGEAVEVVKKVLGSMSEIHEVSWHTPESTGSGKVRHD